MAELPRSVFLLRHLDGLEVAAISVQLGVAIEDVERELTHAMAVLIWGEPPASHGPGHLCDAGMAAPASR